MNTFDVALGLAKTFTQAAKFSNIPDQDIITFYNAQTLLEDEEQNEVFKALTGAENIDVTGYELEDIGNDPNLTNLENLKIDFWSAVIFSAALKVHLADILDSEEGNEHSSENEANQNLEKMKADAHAIDPAFAEWAFN